MSTGSRRSNAPATGGGGLSKPTMSVSLVLTGCKISDILIDYCVLLISSFAEHYKVLVMMYQLEKLDKNDELSMQVVKYL